MGNETQGQGHCNRKIQPKLGGKEGFPQKAIFRIKMVLSAYKDLIAGRFMTHVNKKPEDLCYWSTVNKRKCGRR